MRTSVEIASYNVIVSLVIVVGKFAAFFLTDSTGLLADAFESLVNIVSAIAVYFSVRMAKRPADRLHPYGHHKAEHISALVVGILILGAAIAIVHQAYRGFTGGSDIHDPWSGMAINIVATFINVLWASVLVRQGRIHRSPSLSADGKHLLLDGITSVAVMVGIVGVLWTGHKEIDALIAAVVALHVFLSGCRVIVDGASALLDESLPAHELAVVREVIATKSRGALEVHALRTRHAGAATFVDFHLVVPSTMSVLDAHRICDRLEVALRKVISNASITIHTEPEQNAYGVGRCVVWQSAHNAQNELAENADSLATSLNQAPNR